MASLSDSYAQTQTLLDDETTSGAFKAFRTGFVPKIKELYTEAASVYPTRFAKIQESKSCDWCTWTRELYVLTAKTDKALKSGNADVAKALAGNLRAHFDKLHTLAGVLKANDRIYAFAMEAGKESPAPEILKGIQQALRNAGPSAKAKANAEEYAKALDGWTQAVDPILSDGKIEAGELESLRAAAKTLYRAYGIHFE